MSSSIGVDIPRRDAADKLTGATQYTLDLAPGGMLHAAVARSEVAAGRINNLDVSAAEAMPGVRAVVTAADAPGRYGIAVADHPLFADGYIRYRGEPLAAVAADTMEQAEAAAAVVEVDIEPFDPILDLADAVAEDARVIHPDWEDYEVLFPGEREGNIAFEASVRRGSVEDVVERNDVTIVESVFRNGRQNQASLEPRVAVAVYEDGRFVIHSSTQHPWAVRKTTASLLGVPDRDVRVLVPPVGGGFGMKYEGSIEPIAALLARESGRPVRHALSRREEMLTGLARENSEIKIRSAVTDDGEIVAREASVLMDCGAYGGEQPFLASMSAHTLMGSYRLGAVHLVCRAIYTNTAPTGAFRACNGTYSIFALERHTDEICAAIGMDRWELRRRNVIGDGSIGSTGQVFEGDVLEPMLAKMDRMRPDLAAPTDGRLVGRGVAIGTWFTLVGPSTAAVNLNDDGSATLITAGVEIGSGSMVQGIPQIVAEELGIPVEKVIVRRADTDAGGFDYGVGGGRTTVSIGSAAVSATAEVKRKVRALAAEMLEASPDDLELVDEEVGVVGDPTTRIALAEVASAALFNGGPISGSGAFTAKGVETAPGCAIGHMVPGLELPIFVVHEADVAVHPASGHVEVLAYRVVQDVGKAINPGSIYSQIQGGVVQGLGYALHEEITTGPDGSIEQQGFDGYRLPTALDSIPIDMELHEGAPSLGPFGAKGAGEVPILNVAAAIACAVSDAIGAPVWEIPLTPPRVLGYLRDRIPPPDLSHHGERPRALAEAHRI